MRAVVAFLLASGCAISELVAGRDRVSEPYESHRRVARKKAAASVESSRAAAERAGQENSLTRDQALARRSSKQGRGTAARSRAQNGVPTHGLGADLYKEKTRRAEPRDQSTTTPRSLPKRIVGGRDANVGEFPFFAAFLWTDDEELARTEASAFTVCGGSLIAPTWILTAVRQHQ